MKIGQHNFNPELKSVAVATLIVLLLVSLGFWQVSRRSEKLGIESQIKDKNIAEIINLNTDSVNDGEGNKYRKVKVKGSFVGEGITFIDNIPHDGDYGFYVYLPLKVEGNNKIVLVNHGWIPYEGSRTNLPEVTFSKEIQLIEGSIRIPSKRPFVPSSVDKLEMNKKNLWLYMDLDKYADEASFDIYPFVIYQLPEEGSEFIRNWPVFNPKTAMHTGYAIMWFSLAVIAFTVFVFGNLRKNDGEV